MALFNQKEDEATPTTSAVSTTKPSTQTTNTGHSVFGETLIVEGTINSKESLTVNGTLKGDVTTTENITIGSKATIDAGLTGKTITISGTVRGNISASEALVLESSAVVNGDVTAKSIQIQSGARIEGAMHIGDSATTPKTTI